MSPNQELSPEIYRSLAEFRYELRRFIRFSEKAARTAGLPPQQHQVLLAVKGMPSNVDPTISAISERLQLLHHSVVELIDRMANAGLLRRERQEQDKRVVHIVLTPKGEKLLHSLSVQHLEELQKQAVSLTTSLRRLARRKS